MLPCRIDPHMPCRRLDPHSDADVCCLERPHRSLPTTHFRTVGSEPPNTHHPSLNTALNTAFPSHCQSAEAIKVVLGDWWGGTPKKLRSSRAGHFGGSEPANPKNAMMEFCIESSFAMFPGFSLVGRPPTARKPRSSRARQSGGYPPRNSENNF